MLYKADLQKKWTLRKSGPWTFTKTGFHVKIDCIGQHIYEKLEAAGFKCDNNFSLKLQPKNT